MVLLLIGTASCDRMSPVDPGPDLASYSHQEWQGCVNWNGLHFETVLFAKGSAQLDAEDEAALLRNIELSKLCPGEGFHVVGQSAQERGAKQLAAARARVVADFYTAHMTVEELWEGRMEVSSYIVIGGCGGKKWGPSCDIYWSTITY